MGKVYTISVCCLRIAYSNDPATVEEVEHSADNYCSYCHSFTGAGVAPVVGSEDASDPKADRRPGDNKYVKNDSDNRDQDIQSFGLLTEELLR